MNEKIIKWGFIGCGEVTKYKSGPAFQKIEHSEVVAVMSRDISKAKAYAKERGIAKWYNDAQELINDEEVNAVYIATPPSSHATYAIMSMKAGKPVNTEKHIIPLSPIISMRSSRADSWATKHHEPLPTNPLSN